jgi:hypothetical protein
MFKVLHPNVPDGVMFKMWVHTMGCTDQLQTLHEHEMVWFLKKQNKNVVLQPIEIMGTIDISDQSTTPINLIDSIDEIVTSIRSTAIEFPTLQLHWLSNLKVLQDKQQDLLARGIVIIED